MTKRSLIFAATLVASISIAGVAFAQTSPFEGFYVGGQASYSNIDVEVTVAGLGSADDNLDGFGGGGFVGFGVINGPYYVAVEAEVGYDGADWSETSGGLTLDAEAQLTYGASFRVGAVIDDRYLIYGRAGYVLTNVELTGTLTGVGTTSADEDFNGFRFGGGVEGMFADNIGVRGEYTYTIYDDPYDIPGLDVDTNQHLFRIGLAYYF